jgi:Spy/CpxP family protein refolding chaperone
MLRRLIPAAAAIVILLGVSTLSMADATSGTPATQPAAGQGRLAKLKEAMAKLDLTSGQKEKIKTIMEDARSKMEAARSGGTVDKTQARTIIRDALEKIMATLSPEQKAKLREMMKEEKAGSATQP